MAQKSYGVTSPDGRIHVGIELAGKITFSVAHESDPVIAASPISMRLTGGEQLGATPQLKNVKSRSVNQIIQPFFYKRTAITDQYNEIAMNFKGDYSIIFRAYNDGVAYRFVTNKKNDFQVENEEAGYTFGSDGKAIVAYVNRKAPASFEEQFFNSFENTYTVASLSQLDPNRLAFLPLVVEVAKGKKVCITEADLEDYPGMYLNHPEGTQTLKAVFAGYPGKMEQGGHNRLQELVKEREPFIAKVKGTRTFPWRVMVISTEDKQLADNDMVYKLASPSRVSDISWVKPGKVAWDWWNDWNVYGVDFKSGINNATYQYYIDFAAANNIAYIILDEGWSVNLQADLMQVIPEINLKDLVEYGKKKNVGVVLWVGYYAFNRDMEKVCRHYADLGVKGFKVDFMDRDDQAMVNFYYRAAETAARHHLFLDFHGAYKPTGLQRTYPNVLAFEGVHGLEQMKWSDLSVDQVTYDVTIPFIRMLAGPMDYTQGSMHNATKGSYRPVNGEPMSQGTRCRQLAEYVIFEDPFNMLCDNPSNYFKEPECTRFIASAPTTWDNTVALDGRIGEYVALARQKGKEWYVGALTNWTARDMEVDLSFLPAGNFKAEVFKDGINADRAARDYKHDLISVPVDRKLRISLAPGGGFAARIYPE